MAQVRGLDSIKHFSQNLMSPYQPAEGRKSSRVVELEAEVSTLKARIKDFEGSASKN